MASEMNDDTFAKKMPVYTPGSRRDWIDDTVNPGDAIQDIEIDADIFYDFFLSIPNIKSIKRFKDYEHEWLAKLEVLATAIPDGSKWVETPKPGHPSRMVQSDALSYALAGKRREVELTAEQLDQIPKEDLINVSRNSWIIVGPRVFKPAVVEGDKKAQDLKEAVKRFDFGNSGGEDAVHILEECAASYKKYTVAEAMANVLETQKKFKLFCDNFDKHMPTYMPKRSVEVTKGSGEFITIPGMNVPVLLFMPSFFPVTSSSFSNKAQCTQSRPLTLRCGDQIPFRKRRGCSKHSRRR